MKITKNFEMPDLILFEPKVFEDERGFFMETFRQQYFEDAGVKVRFVQENHSSSEFGVVRGLHFQSAPGQSKLIRCVRGRIWDVVVDIRPKSSTFGKWMGVEISAKNKCQLFIPVGFAHGFSVLSDQAEVLYKVTSYYDPETERGIAWDDPDLAIDWKVENPSLSKRDKKNPRFRELFPEG